MGTTFFIKVAGENTLTEKRFKAEYLVNADTIGDAIRKLGKLNHTNHILQVDSVCGKKHDKLVEIPRDNGVRLMSALIPINEFNMVAEPNF